MSFKPRIANTAFNKISIDSFIKKFKATNPKEDTKKLKDSLLHFKELKLKGELCECGDPIWIIGSAISGKACFTCITHESDCSNDFEVE